ncbi:MAG: hypothetical protein WC332_01440 [Clostridia bacterium]|jgi:hypothetical protein
MPPWEQYAQPEPWNKYTPIKEETPWDKFKGVGEAALSSGLGAVNWIPTGIMKFATIGEPDGVSQFGEEFANKTQQNLFYQPKTETGKKLSGYVAAPFEYISDKSKQAADWTYDKTGSPILSTAVRTVGEAIPFVAAPIAIKGIKGVKGAVKPPTIDLGKVSENPYLLTPEIPRQERVSPEFTKSVIEPKDNTLQIPQKKDFTLADSNTELIDAQTQMFENAKQGKVSRPIKNKIEAPKVAEEVNVEQAAPIEKVEPTAISQEINVVKPIKTIEPTKPEIKPEIPIEGELKPHGTALRVEEVNKENFGEDIAKYKPEEGMIKAEEAKGDAIVAQGYESAINDLMSGKTPEGVRPGTMIGAISREAVKRGDVDTIWKLGTTPEIHTVGQEIAKDLKSFDQGLNDSPVTAIKSVVKARQEVLERTGQKIDPVKQNAEIEGLKTKLAEVQKRFDDYIASKKPKTAYGSQNKLVTNAEYLKVKAELKEQLGTQLSAGLDPTIAVKLGKIGTYHLEAGVRTFAEWSTRVVEDVGEWAKPHLEELWKKSNEEMKSASNLKRYKTKLTNEEAKLTTKLENLDLLKTERKKTVLDHEGIRLKDARDRVKTAYDAAVRKTGTVTREEATKLIELAKNAANLKLKRDPVKGFASEKERLEYGAAQVDFENYVSDLKNGDPTLSELAKRRVLEFKNTAKNNPTKAVLDLAKDAVVEIDNNSIAIVASADNSFLLRQGLNTLMTHPTVWAKAAEKSFTDAYKALKYKHGDRIARDILHADLVSRDNYINGAYQKAGILAKFEEQYPTSHPARIPYVGRAFRASEVAFTNSALRMRMNTFDLLYDTAKKNGVDMNTTQIKDIGSLVNSATARAHIGEARVVSLVLWAPRMMWANVNVLTGHFAGAGLKTNFARKQAAYNLMKITAEIGTIAAVLNALDSNSVEVNPLSSNFLKYRKGNTRIDFTGGKAGYITLIARQLSGQSKNAQTKIVKDLTTAGYGESTRLSVGLDFLMNKTTPLVREGIYFAKGKNFQGNKPTIGSAVADLTVPIPVQNIYQNVGGDYPDPSATALVGSIVDIFGLNANTYQNLNQWGQKNTKEMTTLKKRVGEERFKQLNIKYNKTVNSKIDAEVKKQSYQKLSDTEKETRIEKIRRDVKRQIIGG